MNILPMLLLALAISGASFVSGWFVKGAFVAQRDLAIVEAKKEFINVYKESEKGKTDLLENKLGELKANEKVIERERIKIVDRDVYHNVCLDSDGLRLIESARTGKADTIKSASEVQTAD